MEIAEELARQQKAISVAEFFEKNRQILGFDSAPRALITCVKEAVDNSLDACEDAGILPDIFVQIKRSGEYYQVIVEDNGPGIVPQEIPRVFAKLLYGSRFHTLRQSRGQQGIGISAAVLYSQLTSGKPTKVISKIAPDRAAHSCELLINTAKMSLRYFAQRRPTGRGLAGPGSRWRWRGHMSGAAASRFTAL